MHALNKELKRKHLHGQQKYSAFSFLLDGRDMRQEAIEELIDGINYLIYQIIKDTLKENYLLGLAKQGQRGIDTFNGLYSTVLEGLATMDPDSTDTNKAAIAKMRNLINLLETK